MNFKLGAGSNGWLGVVLHDVLQPEEDAAAASRRVGQWTRRGLAVVLSTLMILIPMAQDNAFAQAPPMPPAPQDQPAPPQGQPLTEPQLEQMVAPIALYPDALVAQVLAASTYPTQVVEADRWLQAQGSRPPEQIAAGAEAQNWDASVKALTAFPAVLAQMDHNLQWTTDLGNAYYNQPQDVMDAVQAMRQKAQTAGHLQSTPQQVVATSEGAITIAPANPQVVYVPVYDPWTIYGAPYPVYPGYYYAPPPGIFWGGLAIGFGIGIGIGLFAHWGWGWGHWGLGWHDHAVFYDHAHYFTRSRTVINRGWGRPGGPPRGFAGARGAFARGAYGRAAYARPGVERGGFNRPGAVNRAPARPGNVGRPSGAVNRAPANRAAGNMGRPGGAQREAVNRGGAGSRPGGASHSSGGGRPSGGHSSGGKHTSGGGHENGKR